METSEPLPQTARRAVVLSLLMGVPGVFNLMYVPARFVVRGDAAATAERIRASELLFRSGILAGMLSAVGFILLVLTYYHWLAKVDRRQAALMVSFALVSVPLSFAYMFNDLAALLLVRGGRLLSTFSPRQLEELAMMFLGLRGQGTVVVSVFWGLWLFPLAALVLRSGFIPRPIGALLALNGLAYVAVSVVALLFPPWGHTASLIALLPEAAGEGSLFFWLVAQSFARAAPTSPLPALARR